MPKVSVIIVTYNRAWILQEAIDSVLAQTFTDFELIVVDDGSTDDTARLVREYTDQRVSYVYQENRGISAARNNGIARARSGLIAFLDSDDIWYPHKLARQVEFMEHSDADLVHTARHEHVYATGEDWGLRPVNPALSSEDFLRGDTHISMTALVRKSVFDKAGLFDETYPVSNDTEMWLRIAGVGKIAFMKEPLMDFRIHESNISRTQMIRKNTMRARLARKMLGTADPRVHKKIWRRNLSRHLYNLAVDQWDAGEVLPCRRSVVEAVQSCFFVGFLTVYPQEGFLMKVKKSMNPFILYLKTWGRTALLKEAAV